MWLFTKLHTNGPNFGEYVQIIPTMSERHLSSNLHVSWSTEHKPDVCPEQSAPILRQVKPIDTSVCNHADQKSPHRLNLGGKVCVELDVLMW